MEYRHEIITTSKKFPIKYVIHDNAKASILRHWHRAMEISFTIKGSIDLFYISGKTYRTEERDILVINSNEIHSVSVMESHNNLALTLIFPFDFMKSEFTQVGSIYFTLNEKEKFTPEQKSAYKKLQGLMNKFFNIAIMKANDLNFIQLKAVTYEIFYILIRNFSIERKSANIDSDKYIDRLSVIAEYIDNNYAEKLTVPDLANEFHLSVGYLSRFFKRYTGLSIYDYITLVRLNYAHELLLNGSASIRYISEQTGFPNDKAFTTAFKKVYKETPYKYRKSHKKTFF